MLKNFFTNIHLSLKSGKKEKLFRRLFEIISMLLIHFCGNVRTLATKSSMTEGCHRHDFSKFPDFSLITKFP